MLEIARWLWTFALAGAILAVLLTGRWRQIPLFSIWLAATAIQTAAHFSNIDMQGTWWLNWTPVLSALKTCAALECAWRIMQPLQMRAAWIVALAGIAGGATFAAGRVRPDRPWIEAAMIMRHFEAALLAFLLLCMLVAWLLRYRSPERWLVWHSWLLFGTIANTLWQLIVYGGIANPTMGDWKSNLMWWYFRGAACFVLWTAILRNYRSARLAL